MVFAAGLGLYERRTVAVLFVFSAVALACAAADAAILYHDPAGALLGQLALSPALATLAFAAVLVGVRHHTLAAARRLVRADQARYDALWLELLSGGGGAAQELAELRALALALVPPRQPEPIPRQYHRLADGDGPDPARPILSLDQLYVQVIRRHRARQRTRARTRKAESRTARASLCDR